MSFNKYAENPPILGAVSPLSLSQIVNNLMCVQAHALNCTAPRRLITGFDNSTGMGFVMVVLVQPASLSRSCVCMQLLTS